MKITDGSEILNVMTPIEKFWLFGTLAMFITTQGDKYLNLKFLGFPVFLRMFKEMLKQMGMKNIKKIIIEWEWLIYATFLVFMSFSFGKEKIKCTTDLVRKCEELAKTQLETNDRSSEFDSDFESVYSIGIAPDIVSASSVSSGMVIPTYL